MLPCPGKASATSITSTYTADTSLILYILLLLFQLLLLFLLFSLAGYNSDEEEGGGGGGEEEQKLQKQGMDVAELQVSFVTPALLLLILLLLLLPSVTPCVLPARRLGEAGLPAVRKTIPDKGEVTET